MTVRFSSEAKTAHSRGNHAMKKNTLHHSALLPPSKSYSLIEKLVRLVGCVTELRTLEKNYKCIWRGGCCGCGWCDPSAIAASREIIAKGKHICLDSSIFLFLFFSNGSQGQHYRLNFYPHQFQKHLKNYWNSCGQVIERNPCTMVYFHWVKSTP